ncbi:MAG: Mur ligase domain-containing protein [Rothia sp. (in: high G+C Gram-positive bacteria)]|nr:Mur ligase domain-containing protein [Rothia sp. (in: high G+C Gram-positive bacteria)]
MTEKQKLSGNAQTLRPVQVAGCTPDQVVQWLAELAITAQKVQGSRLITGLTMDSREVQPGDLYVALGGAKNHGAQFVQAALELGAVAVLTDAAGLDYARAGGDLPSDLGVILLLVSTILNLLTAVPPGSLR